MRWKVNHDEVARLAAELGLTKPVQVVTRALGPKYVGRQDTGPDGHVIELNSAWPDGVRVNLACAHELAHCVQREALGDHADTIYDLLLLKHGYGDHPLEVEATEFAYAVAPSRRLVEVG